MVDSAPAFIDLPGDLEYPGAAHIKWFESAGFRLRILHIEPPEKARGMVLLSPGRSEFIEKYIEVYHDLYDRGFGVIALDHRGQGLSQRYLKNPLKGHAKTYFHSADDLARLASEFVPEGMTWILMCHSMGGAIGLLAMLSGKVTPDAAVLSSPMLGLKPLRSQGLRNFIRSQVMIGRAGSYIPGAEKQGFPEPFEINPLTSDKDRYLRWRGMLDTTPALRLAGPTFGWVNAAMKAIFYIRKHASALKVPSLIIASADDPLVDPDAQKDFAKASGAELVHIEDALHEVLMEQDKYRDEFWTAFDGFMEKVLQ